MENNVIPVTALPKNKPKNSRTGRYMPIQKPTARHEAVKTLLDHSSLTQVEIAAQLNYKPEYIRELKKKLDKTSIVTAKTKRLAKRAVMETLEMKAVTETKLDNKGNEVVVENKPTHSNRLTAAAMVLDRSEPIIQRHQTESVNINLDGTLLDYSQFQDR